MAHNLFGLPYDIPVQNLPRGPQDTGLSIGTQAKIAAGAIATAGYIGGKALEGTVTYGGRFIPTGNTRAGKRFRSGGQDLITEHFPSKKQKPSQSNLRSKQNMPTATPESIPAGATTQGATGVANSKGEETKVIPIPKHITLGNPDFFTTKLIYRTWIDLDFSTNLASTYSGLDQKFRMNSIYDVDKVTAGQNQPQWRDFYTTMYNYYTVIGCDYNAKFINENTSDWVILHRTYGDILPASFEENQSVLKLDPHLTSTELPASSTMNPQAHISGYISHLDYKSNIQEVAQDGNDHIWTAFGADPDLVHDLYIMPRRRRTSTTNDEILQFEIELVYTVQFKELKAAYQFNTPS